MKRAEEAAWKWATENKLDPYSMGRAYGEGYEQAIKAVLKIVNDNIERACRCMEESTGTEEYPYWDGAHDMANAIRREIELEDVL